MKLSSLNNIWLLCKIVLPSTLYVVLLNLKDNFWGFQFVLIFGFIIILFNKKKLKNHFIGSLLLSILLSFLVLFLSMGISSAIQYFVADIIGFNIKADTYILAMQANDLYFLVAIGIISPILMFYCYRILFKIKKTNYTIYIKWISIIILLLLGITNVLSSKDNSILISWQIIMALALQLILYQKELKKLFNPKKTI